MNRFWTRSAIVLTLLIIGSMAIHPPTILAKATKITFTGTTDLLTTTSFEFFNEGESGRRRANVGLQGAFNITASDSAFDVVGGTLVIPALHAHLDLFFQAQGPFHGSVTILDDDGSVIFEGSTTGTSIDGEANGKVVAQGRGRFEGMKLKYSFAEIGNTGAFKIEGTILVPASG